MTIQSVDRAIDILSLFSATRPRLGITDISMALGLSKPTIHGLVRTLTDRGFLQQDTETRKYSIGLKIYEMGIFVSGTLKINQAGSLPAMRLAQSTKQMTRLALWDADSILVTLNFTPSIPETTIHHMGIRVPAYCTASGKSILAKLKEEELKSYLDRVTLSPLTQNTITSREQLLADIDKGNQKGYFEDREEAMIGLTCISAAIFDQTNRPVASISVSGGTGFVDSENISSIAFEMNMTANEISQSLGYLPLPMPTPM